MIFPELKGKNFAKIDLDSEARHWLAGKNLEQKNPLLDPSICEKFVAQCHERLGIDFSYGGWLENRSALWQGSYLDDDERYIHLGIDFNVPAGTAVALPRSGTIIRIDNDHPEPYGWGNRIIVNDHATDCVWVFAHLANPERFRVGDSLDSGAMFARVGDPSVNGGWFPHLHVQIVSRDHYQSLRENDLRDLDGYGKSKNIEFLRTNFPDPMLYTGMLESTINVNIPL